MTAAGLAFGCVIHWKDFVFSDGETADKFLVVLGCKPGCNIIAVVGTSKQHRRTFQPGCNSAQGYFHIPGGGKDFFPKDTWLVLSEPYEFRAADFIRAAMVEKSLVVKGHLRTDVANGIRNCLKICPDVSAAHIKLLQ